MSTPPPPTPTWGSFALASSPSVSRPTSQRTSPPPSPPPTVTSHPGRPGQEPVSHGEAHKPVTSASRAGRCQHVCLRAGQAVFGFDTTKVCLEGSVRFLLQVF